MLTEEESYRRRMDMLKKHRLELQRDLERIDKAIGRIIQDHTIAVLNRKKNHAA